MGERRDLSVRLSNPPSPLLFSAVAQPSRQDDGLWKRRGEKVKVPAAAILFRPTLERGERLILTRLFTSCQKRQLLFPPSPSSPSAPKVVFLGVARPPCFALLSPRSPLIFRCHKQRLGCQKGKEKWAKGEKRKE